jgi:hypothetical protein
MTNEQKTQPSLRLLATIILNKEEMSKKRNAFQLQIFSNASSILSN